MSNTTGETAAFVDGDVVWVKLNSCWWPGEVCGESRLPEGLLKSMKKQPIAVVKFFQELTFEYVTNLNNIYKYDCTKKREFIKKGLDSFRANRKYMETFPTDVGTAETLTGGNPNIINDEEFTQTKKQSWANIFSTPEPAKKTGKGLGRPKGVNSTVKRGRQPGTTNQSSPSSHKASTISSRFLSQSFDEHSSSEHEVRILPQPSMKQFLSSSSLSSYNNSMNNKTATQQYKCHSCNFSSNRLNVIVLHNKTHSNEINSKISGGKLKATSSKTKKEIRTPTKRPASSGDKLSRKLDINDSDDSDSSSPVRTPARKTTKRQIKSVAAIANATATATTVNPTAAKVKAKGKRKKDQLTDEKETPSKKTKTDIEIKNKLLADWTEDESDNDATNFASEIVSKVSVTSDEVKRSANNKKIDESVTPTKLSPTEDSVHSSVNDSFTRNEIPVPVSSPPVVKDAPVRCRNIPKKDRREFIYEEPAEVSPSIPMAEVVATSIEEVPMSIDEPIPEVANGTEKPELPEPTEKIEEMNAVKIAPVIQQKRKRGSRGKERVSPIIDESSETIDNNTVTPPIDDDQALLKKTPVNEIELQTPCEEPVSDLISPQPDESVLSPKNHEPVVVQTNAQMTTPPKETSCFDFEEEDHEELIPKSLRKSRQKQPSISDIGKSETANEAEDLHRQADESKMPIMQEEQNITDEQNQQQQQQQQQQKIADQKDTELKNEIENLLNATTVPELPLIPVEKTLSDDFQPKDRTLPPKERGKRIFKSRNKETGVVQASVSSPSKTVNTSTEEPDLKIAVEALNNLLCQVSPQKLPVAEPPAIVAEETSLKAAECLMNLSEKAFNSQKVDKELPQLLSQQIDSTNNGGSEVKVRKVHASRKRHLLDAEPAETIVDKTPPGLDSKPLSSPIETATPARSLRHKNVEAIVTKPPITEKTTDNKPASHDQQIITDVQPQKFEARTPKKRKPAIENEDVDDENDSMGATASTPVAAAAAAAAVAVVACVKDDNQSPTPDSSIISLQTECDEVEAEEQQQHTTTIQESIPPTTDQAIFDIDNMPILLANEEEPLTSETLAAMPIVLSDVPSAPAPVPVTVTAPAPAQIPASPPLSIIEPQPLLVSVQNTQPPPPPPPSPSPAPVIITKKRILIKKSANVPRRVAQPPTKLITTRLEAVPRHTQQQSILMRKKLVGNTESRGAVAADNIAHTVDHLAIKTSNAAIVPTVMTPNPSRSSKVMIITNKHGETKILRANKPTASDGGPKKVVITSNRTISTGKPNILSSQTLAPGSKQQTNDRSQFILQGQLIEAGAGGQLVITSKGTIMTTQSQSVSTSRIFTKPNRASHTQTTASGQNVLSSSHVAVRSKSSGGIVATKSSIKSPSKIQVQSQKIIYQPKSSRQQHQLQTANPATSSVVIRKRIDDLSKSATSIKSSSISSASGSASCSSSAVATSSGGAHKVIKMTPQRLAEFTKHGLVEDKPGGKVFTPTGLKRLHQSLNNKDSRTPPSPHSRDEHPNVMKGIAPVKTTPTVVGAGAIAAAIPSTVGSIKTNRNQKRIIENQSKLNLSTKFDQVEEETYALQTEQDDNTVVEMINPEEDISTEMVIEGDLPQECVDAVTSQPPAVPISGGSDATSNLQDSQLLALPGESFGGPPNSFFLCTVGDNGSFIPIDDQPLYLDDSNQLVPTMPDEMTVMNTAIVDEELPISPVIDEESVTVAGNQSFIINTEDGQQILLDQQSLLALATGGDMPQLVTADGQQLILQGSAQDILSAIAANQVAEMAGGEAETNQDILAAALAGTEVFQADHLLGNVLQPLNQPPVTAHVSETNAVLHQPPIMSTLEVPSKKPLSSATVGLDCQNIDDSLAVIGVTPSQTHVPTSLELPITVTNPAIAPKTTTAPISLAALYPALTQASPISPVTVAQDLNFDLFATFAASLTSPSIVSSAISEHTSPQQNVKTTEVMNGGDENVIEDQMQFNYEEVQQEEVAVSDGEVCAKLEDSDHHSNIIDEQQTVCEEIADSGDMDLVELDMSQDENIEIETADETNVLLDGGGEQIANDENRQIEMLMNENDR